MKAAALVGAAIVLLLLLMMTVFAPAGAYDTIPLAPPSVIALYQDAADQVGADREVTIDWKQMLLIEAVRRDQDFSGVTRSSAESLARSFTQHHSETTCQPPPNETDCTTDEWYTVYSLEEMMGRLGFDARQREWLARMQVTNLDQLADVAATCVAPGWSPHPHPGWVWPLVGYTEITSCYGPRVDPVEGIDGFHYGVDIGAPSGVPVLAAHNGVVTLAGEADTCGLAVKVDHGALGSTRYCHMSKVSVAIMQQVRAGETIGLVGSTGKSTGPHLHLEYYRAGQAVDPLGQYR